MREPSLSTWSALSVKSLASIEAVGFSVKLDTYPRVSIELSALLYIAPLAEIVVPNQASICSQLNNKETVNVSVQYSYPNCWYYSWFEQANRLEERKGPLIAMNTPKSQPVKVPAHARERELWATPGRAYNGSQQ